jgi:hypothetical protein
LSIETDPPGAEVRLNGVPVGRAPLRVAFRHYGVYRIELEADGFAPVVREEPVGSPWYARFPLCLFTEALLPLTIRDSRRFHYSLQKAVAPARAELLERAAARTE